MKFTPFSVPFVLYAVISLVDALYQSESELDFLDRLLSTEKVLSFILVYFTVWIVPRTIWPKVVEWIESKATREHEYRMAELKIREAAEEQQMVWLMKLVQVGVDVRDIAEKMGVNLDNVEGKIQELLGDKK